jgi:hypothetical protein
MTAVVIRVLTRRHQTVVYGNIEFSVLPPCIVASSCGEGHSFYLYHSHPCKFYQRLGLRCVKSSRDRGIKLDSGDVWIYVLLCLFLPL